MLVLQMMQPDASSVPVFYSEVTDTCTKYSALVSAIAAWVIPYPCRGPIHSGKLESWFTYTVLPKNQGLLYKHTALNIGIYKTLNGLSCTRKQQQSTAFTLHLAECSL